MTGYLDKKLNDLLKTEEMDLETFLEVYHNKSVVPGICLSINCDYTTDCEPDARRNWCEECAKNTVSSGLVLAGII